LFVLKFGQVASTTEKAEVADGFHVGGNKGLFRIYLWFIEQVTTILIKNAWTTPVLLCFNQNHLADPYDLLPKPFGLAGSIGHDDYGCD
jgi:hypothetical protein